MAFALSFPIDGAKPQDDDVSNKYPGPFPPEVDKPPFAIPLAPGEQELVGNPMPTRRRRCQPRSRKTLLDYPQLFRRRPSTAATRVDNFKATDVASVSKGIHTDNQLHAGQFGKAAYVG